MWESAQDRDLPECGFPHFGTPKPSNLGHFEEEKQWFWGPHLDLLLPALQHWILLVLRVWPNALSFGLSERTCTHEEDNQPCGCFLMKYVAAKKNMFSMPQNILPQAWMVEQIHSKWSTQKGFTGTDTQTPQMPLCWSRQPIGTPSQTLNSRSAPFRETSRSVAFLGSD